ncbi:protein kinase domain-containing protein [Sorangium sp. So ce1099]|uniref:serine/threonine-protein kinase n=1 Tax=Sorangium sp. So ce1099 TaxID=3133331 RepID=UPI003F5DD8C4
MSLDFHEGTLFAGRYRVVRGIATGAMGAVYEVIHVETERRRALKVMHPHLAESPEFRARFKLEARIAARVATEHIVEVFDAGIDRKTGMPFLVMELLRGEDLSKRLRRSGRLPPEEAVAYLRQIALALDKTHAAGVVHRDLKPANLFLAESDDDEEPRIKVLDFGIAKLVAETAVDSATTAGVGTPLYMAPEQFDGGSISGAVDIFALGMIAYTLLVGKAYWLNDMREFHLALAFVAVAVHGPQEPACARAAAEGVSLPPAFDAWFAKATARAPEARFATVSAAVEALAEVFHLPSMPVRSSRLSALETPLPRGSVWPASPVSAAARFSSAGVETRVVPAKPRSRSALAVAALVTLGVGGGAIALTSLGDRAPAALGGAERAQAAQAALSPAAAPPDAAVIEASVAPRGHDVVAPAPSASAPRADSDPALAHAAPSASAKRPAMPPPDAKRKPAPSAQRPTSAASTSRESLYTAD